MKFLVVFALLIVAALALPAPQDVTQVKYDYENPGDNTYKFA